MNSPVGPLQPNVHLVGHLPTTTDVSGHSQGTVASPPTPRQDHCKHTLQVLFSKSMLRSFSNTQESCERQQYHLAVEAHAFEFPTDSAVSLCMDVPVFIYS